MSRSYFDTFGPASINYLGMTILDTSRLHLRHFEHQDAAFIVELLNEPAFLEHIGNKGVRTEQDAIEYLEAGPIASYNRHGFGLYCVELKNEGIPIGMCGLLKRDTLDDPDIGFAFLKGHRRQGYGLESTAAVLDHAFREFGLQRVVAITSPGNIASSSLLVRIGMQFEGQISMDDGKGTVDLYAITSVSNE